MWVDDEGEEWVVEELDEVGDGAGFPGPAPEGEFDFKGCLGCAVILAFLPWPFALVVLSWRLVCRSIGW